MNFRPLRVLVCGNVNVELALAAPQLPLPAVESRDSPHALTLGVSGVGFNVAHALSRLGAEVRFLGFAGNDAAGEVVRHTLTAVGIAAHLVPAPATPLSLVLTGLEGRRQIHRDLKGLADRLTPLDAFSAALPGMDAAILTNVAWTRDLLPLARAAGVRVITDLQATPGPGHPYDAPYLAGADVVFLSAENLRTTPEDAERAYQAEYNPEVIVIGLGERGALLSERGRPAHLQPAVHPRPVVSTNGAGDALLAAFTRAYFGGRDAREALRLACTFASWTCGEPGGAARHLSWAELAALAAAEGSPPPSGSPQL